MSYGLTLDSYNSMLLAQSNKCLICEISSERKLYVDHCHKSKKVRGLLCQPCNSILGFAKDQPWILQNAAEYLKRHTQDLD
jgi:hypothetical protein